MEFGGSARNLGHWYSQVGMGGHPSAQARALVTLGNSGRIVGGVYFENIFPRRALKITPQNGVYGRV